MTDCTIESIQIHFIDIRFMFAYIFFYLKHMAKLHNMFYIKESTLKVLLSDYSCRYCVLWTIFYAVNSQESIWSWNFKVTVLMRHSIEGKAPYIYFCVLYSCLYECFGKESFIYSLNFSILPIGMKYFKKGNLSLTLLIFLCHTCSQASQIFLIVNN